MPNHASAQLIGHLGRDPETKNIQGGTLVFNATLAVSTGYGDKKRTTWWNVAAFGKTAETLKRFNLAKGMAIGFIGGPSIREYTDRDGAKRQSLELNANSFILLGSKDDGERSAPAAAAKRATEAAPFDDEIPF